MKRKILSFLFAIIFCFALNDSAICHAQENNAVPYVYDIVSKTYSRNFSDTLNCQSISPSIITQSMLTNGQKKVSFTLNLTGQLHYDRLSGSYVSASSPTATLSYTGPVNLGLYNVKTDAIDKGSYVTFTCSATIKGTVEVNGFVTTINYGSIYHSFNQSK